MAPDIGAEPDIGDAVGKGTCWDLNTVSCHENSKRDHKQPILSCTYSDFQGGKAVTTGVSALLEESLKRMSKQVMSTKRQTKYLPDVMVAKSKSSHSPRTPAPLKCATSDMKCGDLEELSNVCENSNCWY